MPETPQKEQPERLSERVENHREEIQYLVKQGGEQARYEFKRSLSLAKVDREDRLDFVKLVQALANNAEIAGERCIVIGADPKEKKFFPVTNSDDFDPANLSKIVGAYLEPVPRFERFTLTTDNGEPFVVVVLDANQPKPIFVKKQGQTDSGKVRLEHGDIWMKKNTDTVHATRADIEAMYNVRIEEEAEDRARKRLKHLHELGIPSSASTVPTTASIASASQRTAPDFELLIGLKSELRRYAEELIATENLRRLRMLLELARETLVQGWDKLSVRGFPAHMAVDAPMMDVVFYGKQPHERLMIYARFLRGLLKWQAEYRRQVFGYWGYAWSWPGRLGELVKQEKERESKKG